MPSGSRSGYYSKKNVRVRVRVRIRVRVRVRIQTWILLQEKLHFPVVCQIFCRMSRGNAGIAITDFWYFLGLRLGLRLRLGSGHRFRAKGRD